MAGRDSPAASHSRKLELEGANIFPSLGQTPVPFRLIFHCPLLFLDWKEVCCIWRCSSDNRGPCRTPMTMCPFAPLQGGRQQVLARAAPHQPPHEGGPRPLSLSGHLGLLQRAWGKQSSWRSESAGCAKASGSLSPHLVPWRVSISSPLPQPHPFSPRVSYRSDPPFLPCPRPLLTRWSPIWP